MRASLGRQVAGRSGRPRQARTYVQAAPHADDRDALINDAAMTALSQFDETVRTLPITGVFDAYDADSFAAFVATLNGVVVRKTPPRIRVLRQPSAPRESLPLAR